MATHEIGVPVDIRKLLLTPQGHTQEITCETQAAITITKHKRIIREERSSIN